MVQEIDRPMSGNSFNILLTRVVFPVPEGAEITKKRPTEDLGLLNVLDLFPNPFQLRLEFNHLMGDPHPLDL